MAMAKLFVEAAEQNACLRWISIAASVTAGNAPKARAERDRHRKRITKAGGGNMRKNRNPYGESEDKLPTVIHIFLCTRGGGNRWISTHYKVDHDGVVAREVMPQIKALPMSSMETLAQPSAVWERFFWFTMGRRSDIIGVRNLRGETENDANSRKRGLTQAADALEELDTRIVEKPVAEKKGEVWMRLLLSMQPNHNEGGTFFTKLKACLTEASRGNACTLK